MRGTRASRRRGRGWISAPVSLGAATASASGEVLSGLPGKCLDVNGGNSADGTSVQLWSCNHGTAQSWKVYSDGTLRALGKCLDATAGVRPTEQKHSSTAATAPEPRSGSRTTAATAT
ncbi:ricin-type beta-trefoil lectin domain protein [Catenulispora yoronensis]